MTRLFALAALLLGALLLGGGWAQSGAARQAGPEVLVVPIEGTIDLGLAPFLGRMLRAADAQGATVVLELATPGGRLDAAIAMRDALLAAPAPTIAFVDREAFSAGALIALAADRIYMAEAFRSGQLGVMDHYRMQNVQADTRMRSSLAGDGEQNGGA